MILLRSMGLKKFVTKTLPINVTKFYLLLGLCRKVVRQMSTEQAIYYSPRALKVDSECEKLSYS